MTTDQLTKAVTADPLIALLALQKLANENALPSRHKAQLTQTALSILQAA